MKAMKAMKATKKAMKAKVLIERYYPRLTLDFQTNKKICEEIAVIPSKRLRNKIAGFITHLMRRIQKGPVRGISFKLQEEERERKDNYVPEFSAIVQDVIEVDQDTQAMLRSIEFGELQNTQLQLRNPLTQQGRTTGSGRRPYDRNFNRNKSN